MIISLLIGLIVAGLIYYLVTLIPLPEPFPVIIKIVVILALILWVLQAFGVFGGTKLF